MCLGLNRNNKIVLGFGRHVESGQKKYGDYTDKLWRKSDAALVPVSEQRSNIILSGKLLVWKMCLVCWLIADVINYTNGWRKQRVTRNRKMIVCLSRIKESIGILHWYILIYNFKIEFRN